MGASSLVRVKSLTDQDEQTVDIDQLQMVVPQINVQDTEINNNHIFVNPHEQFLTLIDECDLLNNNTTLINSNFLTSAILPTTMVSGKTNQNSLSLVRVLEQKNQFGNKNSINTIEEFGRNIMQRENLKKSLKHEKTVKESEKKKKKKEKPKAPRAPAGGGGAAGRRGMADQDQLMRRPRKNLNTKAEK
jgi:hypothetical protein